MAGFRKSRAARSARRTRRGRAAAQLRTGSAPELLFLLRRPVFDGVPRMREIVVELYQGDTRVVLLVGVTERHPKLEKFVGRLRALRITFVAVGKSRCRFGKFAARKITLTQPILSIASKRIIWVLSNKAAQRVLGTLVVGLAQQAKGGIVLL